MAEAFVDLLYRGLPLGSRARMSQFDALHAYVELPTPMPVGTLIAIQAEGGPISAHVIEISEQTAGSERPPGMRIRPVLDGEAKLAWWAQASGDPSMASRAPDAPQPEVKADAAPSQRAEAAVEALVESPIIAPRSQRADTDVEEVEVRPTEPMDVPPLPAASEVAASGDDAPAEATDEPSGAVSAADLTESPEPPASSGDASPRGRNKRRNKRR